MARRAPAQERSIASMNRMLDAGEQLFFEGGNPGLTLNAVIERAETSTGSFYARFGDMRGFLDAMHERVLRMLAVELDAVIEQASAEPDLAAALQTLCTRAFDVTHRHKAQVYFFAVGNSQDVQWRTMGSQFALGAVDSISQLMRNYLPKPANAHAKRRIDIAGRMIIAAVFQQVMFDQGEISRINMSQNSVATELAAMTCTYLHTTPTT